VNLQTKERLTEVVLKARGTMSRRAFSKLLGVSPTAVLLWERGETMPETDNMAQIAARAGYTLEGLLSYLEGKPGPQPTDLDQILRQIQFMPLQQVAAIGHAVADRLAAVAKEYKAG
jgi:transcriptional regulator with XRE-family HTH domain